jgi:hypothetical protein
MMLALAFLLLGFVGKASGQWVISKIMAAPEEVADAYGELIEI